MHPLNVPLYEVYAGLKTAYLSWTFHRVQNTIFLMWKLYENGSEEYKYHVHFLITNFSIES